ncbi:MAG: porin family protein [Epsilonproteobacteria bacterium]|nr:MAG: porin family protein [Campylobacterota bacterium]
MKKFNLSLVAVLAMSTFAIAGGDIAPVEPVVETPYVEESTGGLYLGAAYSIFNSDANFIHNSGLNFNVDADDYSAMMLQAGYKFNDYVAVEGRYWIGLTEGNWDAFGNTFDSDVNAWGIYVKPMYPVTDSFDIYGLLGYASVDADHAGTTLPDANFDGFSWGIGAAYSFTENFAVFVDYTDFQDDDFVYTTGGAPRVTGTFEHEIDSINFGLTYQF